MEMGEVVERRLTSDKLLVDDTSNSADSEPSVLNLLQTHLGHFLRGLGKSERVKSEVTWLAVALKGLLQCKRSENLSKADPQQELLQRATLDEVVVHGGRRGGGARRRAVERESEDLWEDQSNNRKHAHAAVL